MKRIACIRWNNDGCKLPIDDCKSQIAERCRRFSPIVGWEATDGESLLLDITGLGHLFGGEAALGEAIVRELAPLGLPVRVAVADTIGAAWAATRYCKLKIENCKLQIEEPAQPIFNLQFAICNLQSSFIIVPSGKTSAFLRPLPVEALRLPADSVRLLHELGLVSVGQLEALPREGFLPRFGPMLLRRLDQALGRIDEPVPACQPPPRFAARWSAEYPTARRETIEAVLERLIDRVADMLARCGRGVLRLECRLATEIRNPKSEVRNLCLSVGLFQPTAAAKHLFELVQLQLEQLRIRSPLSAIRVAATLTAPLEPPRQATLFDFGGQSSRHTLCAGPARGACGIHYGHLAALLERLSSRLGAAAVLGVRLRPEAQPELAWHYDPLVGNRRRRRNVAGTRRVPWPHAERAEYITDPHTERAEYITAPHTVCADYIPPRPLRLLPRPQLLDMVGGTLRVPDPHTACAEYIAVPHTECAEYIAPLWFRLDGREHRVARHWGPERIETGWWRGRAVGRDYFRVETAAGCRYWLFRRLRDGKWFLHGVFE